MNERERAADRAASLDRSASTELDSAALPNPDSTGEDVCPTCGGSGLLDGGAHCADCSGTGTIAEAVSGSE